MFLVELLFTKGELVSGLEVLVVEGEAMVEVGVAEVQGELTLLEKGQLGGEEVLLLQTIVLVIVRCDLPTQSLLHSYTLLCQLLEHPQSRPEAPHKAPLHPIRIRTLVYLRQSFL